MAEASPVRGDSPFTVIARPQRACQGTGKSSAQPGPADSPFCTDQVSGEKKSSCCAPECELVRAVQSAVSVGLRNGSAFLRGAAGGQHGAGRGFVPFPMGV